MILRMLFIHNLGSADGVVVPCLVARFEMIFGNAPLYCVLDFSSRVFEQPRSAYLGCRRRQAWRFFAMAAPV